jgi:hypothetical protein
MDNYPAGAANDPRAPYNQIDPEEEVREVEYSCLMRRVAEVSTTDYIAGSTYPEWDDGRYIAVTEEPDFENTNWVDEWKNQEYTPADLIGKLKEVAETLAKGETPTRPRNSRKNYWSVLAKACEGWEQEDEYAEMV